MIQLSEFFQYSFVGASWVGCGESGTPSTIIYTRWSSRRYELGYDAPVMGKSWDIESTQYQSTTESLNWIFLGMYAIVNYLS